MTQQSQIFMFDPIKAVQRMRQSSTTKLVFQTDFELIEWEFIPVSQARDYDGTFAGWDDRPNETVLQLMIWRNNETPRYTNFWNFKLEN